MAMGTIGTDGALEVDSVARIDTRYLRGDGRQTSYVAQHLDGDGRVLAEDVLYTCASDCGCGGRQPPKTDCHCDDASEPKPLPFKAMLRDTAPGSCLRIAALARSGVG